MTRLAIDIDDTLYNFADLARDVAIDQSVRRNDPALRRLAYTSLTEWRSPLDVVELDSWLEVIAECHAPSMIRQQKPYVGAAMTLTELADQGFELHYISNRRADAEAETRRWLYQHNFPLANQQLTCTEAPKIPLIHDCQYIIDDRPRTLVAFAYDYNWTNQYGSNNAAKRRLAFGLHRPYNAALTDVAHIKLAPNWRLLREYLVDAELLAPTDSDQLSLL